METVIIEKFPASKLDDAFDALDKVQARLIKAAAKAGQAAPEAPVLKVTKEYGLLRCGTCKRMGGVAGAWKAASPDSPAYKWGDSGPCDPFGFGGGTCGGHMKVVPVVDLELLAPKPALAGWEFLAVVEPLEGGNLIKQVPGSDSEGVDFGPWRTGAVVCDHCQTKRRRNETFLVKADGTDPAYPAGTMKQVGRQCLQDFLGGKSAAAILAALTFEKVVRYAGGEDGEGGWFEGGPSGYDPELFLAWTSSVMRLDGWVSKAMARDRQMQSTADQVEYLQDPPFGGGEAVQKWHKAREAYAPTDEDMAHGKAALAWAKALDGLSDYEQNLKLVANQSMVYGKHTGILASAVAAYDRAVGREVQRKADAARAAASDFVGEVGKRSAFELTVERVFDTETQYGVLHIHRMRDAAGNTLVWKTGSKRLDVGSTVAGKCTVKKHSEYKGEKQTELSRCDF